MIKIITDIKPGETDILSAVKHEKLVVTNLDKKTLASYSPPTNGWTTSVLWYVVEHVIPESLVDKGADAYLGEQWVGSTEV